MPTKKDSAGKTPANKQKGKKVCTCCHESKNMTDFYYSASPMYSLDGRVPMCKDCCKSTSLNDDGTINYKEFHNLLSHIDKPLYYDLIFSSIQSVRKEDSFMSDEDVMKHGKEILQKYFTLIAMRQDRSKSYANSKEEGFLHQNNNRSSAEKDEIMNTVGILFEDTVTVLENDEEVTKVAPKKERPVYNSTEKFNVTQEIIDLFGEGYTPTEYKKMAKKYKEMSETYVIQTSIHREALVTYVRFKVKEELATAKGDVAEAQKWYSAAQDAAEKGKLTARQLSKEDLQGGIVNFSDIFTAVEGAKERIKIFPEFKYQPKDAADFIIWNYINYERNLNNLPEVDYKDIYEFYDRKKQEYVDNYGDPYGIFTDDTTESNREAISKFITIPSEFREDK